MEHHDQYDSKTRQSKGLTQKELLAYRRHLYEYVKDQMPIPWPDTVLAKGKTSKKRSVPISVELYDRRLKIYHFARDLIIHVIRYASVDLQRATQFAADTDEALFLYDESVDAYLSELYKKAVRLRTLGVLLENAPIGDQRSSLAVQEGEIVLWFSEQLGELRRKVQPFLQTE
jgi:hypothetical protein